MMDEFLDDCSSSKLNIENMKRLKRAVASNYIKAAAKFGQLKK